MQIERRMNDEGLVKIDKGWRWWIQAVEEFCRQTDRLKDICNRRVAFGKKTFFSYMIEGREDS